MNLREAAQMALDALESSRLFVTSREKIKHPEGTEWYDERIEALRAALAQQENQRARDSLPLMVEALEKLEQRQKALAQPVVNQQLTTEQEPVAWRHWLQVDGEQFPQLTLVPRTDKDDPLYTAPPQREWVGLTDEEQNQVAWSCGAMSADWLDFARAIESKLREKNL